jgi:hypothetical protein
MGIIEKGPGGNFLLNGQATHLSLNNDYAAVWEIDRNTGQPNPALAINFQIIGTENILELGWYNGSLYGVGRYKDGGINEKMRHTLTRLDPVNGSQIWVRMGHRSASQNARLYGNNLVFADNTIFTIYHGDPAGTSTTTNKIYIQRTDLEGNMLWLNQYDLPGTNDWSVDLANSADGGILALNQQGGTGDYSLLKIDIDGNLLWARTYSINGILEASPLNRANAQLIEAGDHVLFAGQGSNASGDRDLIIVNTDLEGNVSDGCVESSDITVQVLQVDGITWYNKEVNEFTVDWSTTVVQSLATEL